MLLAVSCRKALRRLPEEEPLPGQRIHAAHTGTPNPPKGFTDSHQELET